ncbi:MAG: FAD-dependent oxidoreductase [Sphaerochaeta sp.]|jgi:NADPH-dependent 2,4-dienoyl-CoA reductase/sulfur reductase-like enzyme|nr:FAD-dependent oxidoreductase [Sphaerochaeta sp.]MCH3921174.1 FAD-dependent oxidoreductase [Sphaerochaeta sp.]MCI2045309.1 FAD-dependent oxidoreductase [Sphaerochaeta sp.]MCI2076796.1 FAD-dependent oxidoreductase [Sphaerochaeta sp.]MCI2097661.1 FAD-dependent oxidoreductase [Sphaerochaeta sp.]
MSEMRDVVVIGGGPAGLACAVALFRLGVKDVLLLEREPQLGGILRQCIHDGFGLGRFHQALSGPEYAQRFIDQMVSLGVPYETDATVTEVTPERLVTFASPSGIRKIQARTVVFAMGCRERTRGALAIPGERPSGVYTAGTAQAYVNLYNRMVGKDVVILGSGDIGLIMARRLTLEGAHVKAVYEILPHPSGLKRNIHQCLDDYGIPLYLSRTVTDIHGASRLTGVTVSKVDERLQPIAGTEEEVSCDTLILSVGLIPETELEQDAGIPLDPHTKGAVVDEHLESRTPGFFSCGNVLHVHDLVDNVSDEAERTAQSVKRFLEGTLEQGMIPVTGGEGVSVVVPQMISGRDPVTFSLRVRKEMGPCTLSVRQQGKAVFSKALPKALPAEMVVATVPPGVFAPVGDVEVMVSC